MKVGINVDEQIMQLQKLIDTSGYTVVITGAGISMGAGIMDMEHMNLVQTMQTSMAPMVRARPEHSYKLLQKSFLKSMFVTGPSAAHIKIAELEKSGRVQGVITTNIDHLHSLAGSQNVAEIQGSYAINQCSDCKRQYNDVQIWNQGKAPRCPSCNGVVLAFPVYSGVGTYDPDYYKAGDWMRHADLVIVAGSKGMYGGYFSNIRSGTKVVQINPKHTQFDDVAMLNFRNKADEVFGKLQ